MKRILSLTTLLLVLTACGQQATTSTTSPTANSPVAAEGFTIDEHPEFIPRRVTFPAAQPLTVQASRQPDLRPQATTAPWTSPVLFPPYSADIAVGPQGQLFVQQAGNDTPNLPSLDIKFQRDGTRVGSQQLLGPSDQVKGQFLAVTSETAERETYHLILDQNDNLLAQIETPAMTLYKNGTDTLFKVVPIAAGDTQRPLVVRPGQSGFVMSVDRYPSYTSPSPDTQAYVIYEASYQAYKAVEVNQRLTFRPPKQYPYKTQTAFSVAPDGSIYVAMFTPYSDSCTNDGRSSACPVVAGVTKIRGGQVLWQSYWDSAQPLTLQAVSATSNGVSLLANYGQGTDRLDSSIISLDSAGNPLSQKIIPLTPIRQQLTALSASEQMYYVPPFNQFRVAADGSFVLMDWDVLASGTLTGGVQHTAYLNKALGPGGTLMPNGQFGQLTATDTDIYVLGSTNNELGETGLPRDPTAPTAANYGSFNFVLPYDTSLNRRR